VLAVTAAQIAPMTLGDATELLAGPAWACACCGPGPWPGCFCGWRIDDAQALRRAAHIVVKQLADRAAQITPNPPETRRTL
jgi:hypothetical protein